MSDVEIIPPNSRSLEEHIQLIQTARQEVSNSFYRFVTTLIEARNELGDSVFQGELAERVGIERSYLNRILSIGDSQFISQNRDNLPDVFTSLYEISSMERSYREFYGDRSYLKQLDKLVEQDRLHRDMFSKEIKDLRSDIQKKIGDRKREEKEKKRNSVNERDWSSEINVETDVETFINRGDIFSNFVIDLTNQSDRVKRWKDDSIFEEDISEEFPLHDLRGTTDTKTISCLIRVKMSEIEFGLKFMRAVGFRYEDFLVPLRKSQETFFQSSNLQVVHLRSDVVIIRGVRGKAYKITRGKMLKGDTLGDLLSFSEGMSHSPNILVFGTTDREGWNCLIES